VKRRLSNGWTSAHSIHEKLDLLDAAVWVCGISFNTDLFVAKKGLSGQRVFDDTYRGLVGFHGDTFGA
jgi:hypothetical protein